MARIARWMFWRRRRPDSDFADEVESHLQLEADQLQRAGLSVDEARHTARRSFGNVTAWKERFRDARRIHFIDSLSRDLRYAWRGLRRSPSFAIVVAFTLAIGIGANAAVIGVIDTAYLRKLPVPAPERIFAVFSGDVHNRARRANIGWNSYPDYIDLHERVQGAEGLAAYSMEWIPLGDTLSGASVWSAMVSGNYFDVLGVHAAQGRYIRPDEEEPRGSHPVVVISDAFWKSHFASDEHVLGRVLVLGKDRFTIIGVAAPGFTGVHAEGRTDLWIPYTMFAEATGREYPFDNRDARRVAIIGRLAPSASLAQVESSIEHAADYLKNTYPDVDGSLSLRVAKHERLISFEQAPDALVSFILVWVMIALLHLVACSNIASLMLARAAARRRDVGIRICLGASRGRIAMQSLAEPGAARARRSSGWLVDREMAHGAYNADAIPVGTRRWHGSSGSSDRHARHRCHGTRVWTGARTRRLPSRSADPRARFIRRARCGKARWSRIVSRDGASCSLTHSSCERGDAAPHVRETILRNARLRCRACLGRECQSAKRFSTDERLGVTHP